MRKLSLCLIVLLFCVGARTEDRGMVKVALMFSWAPLRTDMFLCGVGQADYPKETAIVIWLLGRNPTNPPCLTLKSMSL